ncbi:MAG: cytochrome b/b6 domain-containing protein [Burkholderiales bacterium]
MVQWRNTRQSYGILAQALHWIVAALVFLQLGLGLYAASLPLGIARLQWLSRHKALGLAVLVLALLRLGWRFVSPPPDLPQSMSSPERLAALFTHRLLYVLLLLVPLAGWLYASAAGLSVNWFGLLRVPDLVPKSAYWAETFKALHKGSVVLLALLLAGHVGATLRHALVLRDGIASRMLPGKRRSSP